MPLIHPVFIALQRCPGFSRIGVGLQQILKEPMVNNHATQTAPINPARHRADDSNRLELLAQETETSLNLVKAIFAEQLQTIENQAKVQTFVSVIAMRRTRLILKRLEAKAPAVDLY